MLLGTDPVGLRQPPGEQRAREAFDALIALIVEQASASRMCFVEIYAAGPEAVQLIDRALEMFAKFGIEQFEQIPGRQGMPPAMVRRTPSLV